MKIHQLPMGARFEYEGAEYVKTGPLLATGPAGQRLIPKYVVLKPLDGVPVAAQREGRPALPRAEVMAAFAAFHAACRALVPQERQAELEAARDAFLKALD